MINFLPLFCFFQKNSQIEFDASYHKKYYNFSFFFYFYILYKFKIILNPIKHFYHCYKSQKINIFIPKRSKSIQLKLNYFHFKTYIFTQNRRHYSRIQQQQHFNHQHHSIAVSSRTHIIIITKINI